MAEGGSKARVVIQDGGSKQRVLMVPIFNGANGKDYPFWKVRLLHHLKQERLLFCLDRIPPLEDYAETVLQSSPEEEAARQARYQKRLDDDDKVVNVLWTSIDNDAMAHVFGYPYAKQIMDKLDQIYLRQGHMMMFSTRKKLYLLSNQKYGTLSDLFAAHERLILDMERAGETVTPAEKINTLLAAVPQRFANILDAIAVMRRDDLAQMSLDQLRGLLLDAEAKGESKPAAPADSPTDAALAADARPKKKKKKPDNRSCYYCERTGHTFMSCRELAKDKLERSRGSANRSSGRSYSRHDRYDRRRSLSPAKKDRKVRFSKTPERETPERKPREKFKSERTHVALSARGGAHKAQSTRGGAHKAQSARGGAQTAAAPSGRVRMIVDSGATDHMVRPGMVRKDCWAIDPVTISTAKDGQKIVSRKRGVMKLSSIYVPEKKINRYELYPLIVPHLNHNLLSVPKLVSNGKKVLFDQDGVVLLDDENKIVASGSQVDGVFVMDFDEDDSESESESESECESLIDDEEALLSATSSSVELWHKRLGHLGWENMRALKSRGMADGLKFQTSDIDETRGVCKPCVVGKQARTPFKRNHTKATRPLEVVHSDVSGPMSTETHDGYRYCVIFVDDFTHFTVTYLMKHKSEVLEKFEEFEAMASAHFNRRISNLRSDNGGEYVGNKFIAFCKQKGIQQIRTCPYTPQQNGISERMNRTLMDRTRSMLSQFDIPRKFWGEALYVATYVTNRSPTVCLKNKTPYEMWFGRKPNLSKLRVFGCTAFVQIPKEKRKKLDDRSRVMMFVGYANNGYRLWDNDSRRIVVSRDVIFDEEDSPYLELPSTTKAIPISYYQSSGTESESISESSSDDEDFESLEEESSEDDAITVEDSDDESDGADEDESDGADEDDSDGADQDEPDGADEELTPTIRRSERVFDRWMANYDDEEETSTTDGAQETAAIATNIVDEIPQRISQLIERDDWPKWKRAIKDELNSLDENRTWTLVERVPKGFKAINSMWVFTIKDTECTPRYKARLVAKGCSQRFGLDYNETFAPVAKMSTIRTILAIAAALGLYVHQMDVKTAFLNGKLEEEVYMKLPIDESGESKLCRLRKSLYGLKQAGRSWNQRFDEVMKQLGFKRLQSDSCVYASDNCTLFIVLYVDDILLVGGNLSRIEKVKTELSEEFQMKDLGPVKSFLGLEIERNFETNQMKISQKAYIEKVLARFGMENCNSISTPMGSNEKWMKDDDPPTEKPYKALLGCLQYLALMSRPDISAAVSILSRFQSCATERHWSGLKRILRYLKGSKDLYLLYDASEKDTVLEGYADADYGNEFEDRKSNSGHVFKVYGNVVSWSTKRQPIVSLSSTEAEFISLCNASKEGIWLSSLLGEIGIEASPFTIYEDNMPCIRIAEEPREHQRSKHIDIRYMFLRELIREKKLNVVYVPTTEQLADVFTKPLGRQLFEKMLDGLRMSD